METVRKSRATSSAPREVGPSVGPFAEKLLRDLLAEPPAGRDAWPALLECVLAVADDDDLSARLRSAGSADVERRKGRGMENRRSGPS